jgi:ATP phosphoribosyltransferase
LRNIDDYELKSTLNYLHEINNIYIIFNEEEKKEFKSTIKKINDDVKNNVNHNNTKRVKFNVPNKKTRRRKH